MKIPLEHVIEFKVLHKKWEKVVEGIVVSMWFLQHLGNSFLHYMFSG